MSGNRGCAANTLLFLIIVFVPLLGHIIETVFVLEDDHSTVGKIVWLAIIWGIPFVGPFLYLVFGQKPRNHAPIAFGQASYYPMQQQYY